MKKLVLIFGILLAFCMSAMAQNLHTNGKMCNGSTTIACGETIYFYDDGGSSKHGRGVNLNHTIKSPEGTRIRITFTSFDVRGTGSYLRLYNGSTTTASYTAITNETTFTSTGNVVLANFYTPSGWYTAGSGWEATIEVVDCPSTLGTVALACGDDAITIGGDAINTSATAYGVDQNAVRTYTAPLGTKLFLNITDLPDDADNDYIIVYDGTSMASPRLGRYDATSSLPISITSTTNALTISFRSNSSVNGSWSATLQPDLCLDELADVELGCDDDRPVGGTYTANMFTRQVFRATNTDAQLMLDLSAIPNDSNNDYIEVYDGDGATATLIGRYFGYGRPSTIASSGNVMTIVFRSNATNNGTWAGVVSVDCPDVIRMPGPGQGHRTYTTCNAMVYDDGGPTGNYSNNLNDEYIVLRPGRSGCVLHLEGEFVFDWQNDWITIYDGVGLTGDVLWGGGHHGHGHSRAVNGTSGCYASTPGASANGNVLSSAVANSYPCATYYPKVTSKSGALTIRFHTNGSQTCDGFSFHVTCVPKPTDCYSTGVIVFKQDFGGNEASDPIWQTTAPADIAAACTYNWVGNGCPGIGDYSIRKFIYDGYQYYNYLDDHTHPGNIERGYLFQGDHDGHTDSYFYKQKINIECEGVDKLMVSLWAANINNEHSNPANMPNLEIGFFSDAACTQSLTGEPILTGTIPNMTQYGNCSNDANEWQFYYAELNSPPAGDVWFRIINTVGTTTGNDFVLDDIEVRACLPPSVLTRIDGGGQIFSSANVCAGDTLTLRADLDYSLGAQSTYTTPYYLWQRGVNLDPSDYDSPIVWTDMSFEGGDYVVGGVAIASTNTNDIGYDASNNPINDASNADNYENYSQVTIYEPPSTTDPTYTRHYYRIIIAGSIDALTSRYCHSASEPHVINVIRIPEIRFGGTNAICEGGEIDLSVTPESPRPGIWSIAKETDGIVENTTPPFNATINTDAGGNYHVTGALHDMITVRYQLDEVNGGCWNEKEIPVYPLPEITITPDVTTICEGSDITLLAASNQTSTFQWDGGPAGAEWLVDPITTTTYTVSVTTPHEIPAQSGSGTEILNCLSSAEKVVNVLPMPGDITVDGAPATPVCPGTVLTFTPSATGAGTLTYSWDGTNYYTAAQPGSTYTVTATTPGTATYTLYVKDTRTEGGVEYNCPATHDVVVTVYDNPTLAVSTLVDINCFGQSSGSFTLTGSSTGTSIAYGSGSTAYYDFSIDDGANFTHATAGNRLQYTFSDLHSGTYHVAIRDGHGCIHKEDVTISETQTAALSAEITDANTTPTCLGQSVGALTVTAENGTQGTAPAPAYTYAWSNLQTTASITDLPADTYTVTVTDAHGCSTTASKEVISRPVPNINASTTANDVCLSSSTSTLTVLNNNTLPIASHSWSVTPTTGAGLPANLGTASLTVTPTASGAPSDPVTYTYTDVVTATNGCVVSGEVVLTVNPTVILDHTSGDLDQTLCFDETLTDIVFERGGGATGFNFAWEGTAPASTCLNYAITGTTLTISEGASPVAGTYRYTVQTTGAISPCDNPSYSGTITIHPELTVSVTADHQSCVTGNIGVATATPAGGRPFGTAPDTYYTYAWNNSGNTATIDNLEGGTYSVTVTDANSCETTNTITIQSLTNPTISVSVTDVLCHGFNTGAIQVTVTNHGTTTSTSNPYGDGSSAHPYYYEFSKDGGTTTEQSSGSNYYIHSFPNLVANTYNIYVRDGNDCEATATPQVTEPSTYVSAQITDANTTPTCLGQSVGALTVTAENGTQGTAPAPAYTYAWSSLQTTASITDLPADTYTVTVTDAHGCSTTASKEIISRPVPSINASTIADDVCLSSSTSTLTVLNNNTLPIASHSWSVTPTTGAGLPANLGTASLTVTPTASGTPSDPVTYTYTDVVTATNGCVVSGEVVLTVNPTVILDHTSGDLDQTLCFDETLTDIVFERDGGATGFNFAWEGTAPATTCLNYAITGTTLTISEGASPVAGTYEYTIQTTGAISPCDNPSFSGTIIIRPELTVSVTADHQSCVTGNIGVATAHPAGGRPFGTAPDTYYNYEWNNSGNTATIDNLEGGTYSVTVTDANSCSVTGSTTIVEKPNPVVAISDVATLCPEIGTTNVAASITTSTTPSYTYTWTNDGSFAVTTTNPVTTTATSVTATVSVPDIATAGCSNTYTLKLQVEDANNCLSNLAEKVITVEDVTAPLLTGTWPANITGQNNCFANADTTGLKNANEIKALFSDCSNITVTVEDASTATSNCGWTWTRTYTIKDACGNTYYTSGTTKPTMSVSGSDQSAPALTGTWPDNITGQNNCFADADISGLYGDDAVRVLFSDCSTITVTHDDVNTRTDNCGWTITRTYTIKDACDNIYYTSGTTKPTMSVSGSDQNIPALTGTWPANITGQDNCFDHADISGLLSNDAVKTLYTDCSAITVSHTDANTSSDDCDWTITRTYTIKDVCNRTTTNSMSVSGSDQSAPAIIGTWPDNITGQNNCFANADISGLFEDNAIKALFTDCSAITVSHTDANTNTDNCGWTITRTYTIKDACDNIYYTTGTTKPTMTVSGSDQSAPVLTSTWPADITGQDNCFANADTTGLKNANEIKALFSDCSNITVTVDDASTATSDCGWTWTRTYTIKDACGNTYYTTGTTKPTMSVSGSDQSAPALADTWPDNITGQNNCFANADISGLFEDNAIKALFTDCSAITVTHTDENTSTDNCDWTITRTYTIKDACDNIYYTTGTTKPTMSVSGKDQNPPTYTVPPTITVYKTDACTFTADTTVTHSVPTALADDCSAVEDLTLTYTDSGVITATCTDTIKRTWRLVDVCGNVSVVDSVQLILITDTIKPTIARNVDAYPALGVGSCLYEIPDLTGQVTVADNCTAVADLVITQDPVAGTPTNMNRDVTITVTDKCGNSRSTTILVEYPSDIHVQANPPVICKGQETTLTVYSGGISTFYNYVWDNGIGETLNTPDNSNIVTVSPAETTTYHVEITNDNNCTQGADITVTVKPLPVITFPDLGDVCPNVGQQEVVANIEATTPDYTYTWTSDLTLNGTATGTQNGTEFTISAVVPNDYTVANNCDRTNWIKLHVSDNDALHCEYESTYTIVIKDDVAPQLITAGSFPTGEENMNLCYADRPVATPDNDIKALYTDNCGGFTVEHTTSESGNNCSWTVRYTYTITDLCGNTVDPAPYIEYTGGDTEDPTITCPRNYSLPADADHNYATLTIPVPATADNCEVISVVNDFNSTDDASGHYPLGTTNVVYTVTDGCSHSVECSFTVVVRDSTPPCIGCDHEDPIDPYDPDDPDGISCEDIVASMGGASGTFNISTTNHEDHYHHGDDSWNITYNDNTTDHSEITVVCNLTGATTATGLTTLNGQDFAIGTTTVTWIVTDTSNNTSNCSFIVVVSDNEDPCIGCDSTSIDPFDPTQGVSCESIVASYSGSVEVGTTEHLNYYLHDDDSWNITANDNVGIASITYELSGATTAITAPNTTLNGQRFEIGTTRVTWIVVDSTNHIVNCYFDVVITDDEDPCIGCDPTDPVDPFDPTDPQGVSCASIVDAMGGTSGTVEVETSENLDYYLHNGTTWDITASDNVGVQSIAYSLSGATTAITAPATTLNGQRFEIGTTHVTWTVTDVSGRTSTCEFDVVVSDEEPPCIGCDPTDPFDPFNPNDPQGVSCASIVEAMGGSASTVTVGTSDHLDYYVHGDNTWNITANDNVGVASIEYSLSGSTTAITAPNTTLNGQRFEIGTTLVTWTVTDVSGVTSTCEFTVVVTDDEDPCIGCDPTDPVDPFDPTDPDGISCASIINTMGGTGTTFNVNTTTNLDYYHHNNNDWDITVNDNVGIFSVVYAVSGATTTVNAPNTTLNGQDFEIGQTTVTWTVTDVSGRTSTCSFTVVVSDEEPPCIGCDPTDPVDPFNPNDPQGVSCASLVAAMGGSASTVTVGTSDHLDYYVHEDDTWNITASDNVGVESIVYSLSGATTAITAPNTTLNGQRFEIGTTLVTWTVTDVSGMTSTCEFTVVITDDEDPCIGCDPTDPVDPFDPTDPQGVSCASIVDAMGGTTGTIEVETSENLDYYLHTGNNWDITASDNVGVQSIAYSLSGATTAITAPATTLNGQRFEIGTTHVTWTVTDVSGRTSTCEFDVVVSDEEPPCIGCDPTDPFDPFNPNDPQGVSCASIVETMGGSASTVTVGTSDHLDYYVHGDNTWNITANDNVGVASIEYSLSGATTAITAPNTTLNGQRFEIGTTLVTWTVTDVSGVTSTCEFTVVVTDDEDPCIGCDPTDPVDPFDPTDPDGISCASIINTMGGTGTTFNVNTTTNLDYYHHNNNDWDITVNDNVGIFSVVYAVSGATTTVNAPNTTLNGQDFEIGQTTVTWTVTDVSGRTSTCSFTVVVSDEEPPCIGCDPTDPVDPFNPNDPQGVSCESLVAAMGGSASTVTVGTSDHLDYYVHEDDTWNITASDNVGVESIVYSLSGATTAITAPNTTLNGQRFEIGTTLVTWTVTDVSGMTSTCEFTVVITDDEDPCIGCDPTDPVDPFDPTDPQGVSCASIVDAMGGTTGTVEVATSENLDYYLHNGTTWDITASDNVGVQSISYSLSGATTAITAPATTLNGQRFEIGTTHVTWTVTDVSGRTSTCEFDVVVSDEEPPCIGCDPTDPFDPFNPNDPQGVSCASIVEAMGGSASTVTVGTSDHLDYYVHGDNTWNITANDNVGVASIEYSLSGATTAITAPNTTLNGQRFEIGTTLVTWTVTDVSGVTSTCEFTVVVTDDEPPCIGCDSIDPVDPFDPTDPDGISCASITSNSGTINVNTTLGQTYYQHTDNSWNVTVNDNSGIASVVYTLSGVTTVVNGSNETLNGQRFNIGVTTVTWTVTDIYGVTNNCEFNVNVTDIEPPTISCPSAIGNIACIDDVPPAYATYAQFAADGGSAYDVNGINESSFALLSQTSDGNTCPEVITRTYQIADVAGNTQTCSQTITINDTILPLISGVQPTLNVGQGQNCQFPLPDFTSVVRAMSTDNCTPVNELVITQVPVAGNATMITENTDVTIYVSDACGNTSQIIGHAVVPQPLVHTVSASEIMCNGQTSVVTIGAQGGVAPYEGIGQIVEPAGTYNYTISDVNGCTSDFEVVIPQPQLLQTEIPDTGVLNVACYGQHTGYASVSVTGGTPGYTFIWSTTPRQTTQRAINLAAGGYSVTVTDAKGCTSTSAITIAQPSAALTASFVSYNVTHVACYGEATGSATITVNGGTTPYEYSWNTSPVQTTATASNLVAGNYSVTITDANGCTLTKPVSINGQSSQLVSSFSNANIHAVNCYGQATGSATVTAVGGTTPYSYLWNTTPAQTTRTATNLLAGEYEVTVTDNHGCTSVSSVTISGQSAPLTAIISSENTVDVQCYGQTTGSASVTATGGSPSYTYSWNTVPAQSTISVNNLAAGNYFVTVTDTHGCSAVASVTINGQSAPLVASFANTNVTNVACYGESSGSAMVTVTGGTPVYSYAWNTSPVQTAPTAQNLVAGNYSVTVTDNHGCTATSSVEITQYPILEASVSSTGANCGGVGGTVVASVSGGTGQYVYSWTNNSGQTYSGVRLSNVMPGTYNLTVSDFNGCSVTGSTFVDSYGTINAHIDVVHAPGCGINESAGSIQAIAESGVAPFSYNWSASGATGMIASDLPAGAYYVTITDNWGCTANASINLEQFNDLAMQMRSTDATCFGVGNGSASAIAVRGEPPYVYAWSNGETTEVISGLRAGRYTITLTDANMCTVTGSVDIDQPEELRLESNVKTISCHGKNDGSIALNAVGGVEPYNFSVRLDDVTFAGTYMTGLFPGTYMMEVSDANGCVSGNVIQLVEPEEFESSYNLTMPSCFGNNDGSIEITATGGTKPYMYGWDSYYSEEPLLTGLREGMYTISVVDANKCTYQVASITLTDMAGACIKIPDVFTPNGDGINDEWIIENIDMFPEATVYVFNRWGQMLYKGTGNDEPWDGRYRGHFVPAGTYLYIVDLYQRTDAYKGTVTVIY